MAWLEKFDTRTDVKSDPLRDEISFTGSSSVELEIVRNACGWESPRADCAAAFDAAADKLRLTDSDAIALQRYEELLQRRAWREVVPLDARAPFPRYGDIIHAQRLFELRLMQLAGEGKVEAVRDGLDAEVVYWRGAMAASDNLLAQMIAVAALRNHFFAAQRILRRLPAGQALQAIPSDWSREVALQERSMLRVMAGEYAFMKLVFGSSRHSLEDIDFSEIPREPDVAERAITRLSNPLFQLQATSNLVADRYLGIAEALAVPIDRYQDAHDDFQAQQQQVSWSPYNPVGIRVFRSLTEAGSSFHEYAIRVASVEGWRRAALLTANLRARGLAPETIGAEVANSVLSDPFTNAAFEWNATSRAVVFAGPLSYPRHREEYFY
jgi:hypothetical protein